MPKKDKKKKKPSIAVPTVNPFTGKPFASEAEKQAFIAEQKAKHDVMKVKREEREVKRLAAAIKILKFFETNGITTEDLNLTFKHNLFSD